MESVFAIPYPEIDPVFFRLGPLAFRWYGLMYLLGLGAAYFLIKSRASQKNLSLSSEQLSDLIVFAAFGVFLGGRLGYILFYNPTFYMENPLKILAVWEGGMSFHGGLVGTCVALWIFSHRRGFPLLSIADLAAGAVPIGLGFGRLGNFINGELYGRATDVSWCMVFPQGGPDCRHPSQLYEALLEGLLLFLILTVINRRQTPPGTIFWSFLIGYGFARFFIEQFRQPDSHIGFLFNTLTMGQLLCLPMILIGTIMLLRGYWTSKTANSRFK
ncbi:MAG: prolipoprotein diacylglyceryl transferase [Nitrospirales bacterium]|nr:MAG: prolipoprotein diacylglyceryl transferase [Nitrospirales bacterium]